MISVPSSRSLLLIMLMVLLVIVLSRQEGALLHTQGTHSHQIIIIVRIRWRVGVPRDITTVSGARILITVRGHARAGMIHVGRTRMVRVLHSGRLFHRQLR